MFLSLLKIIGIGLLVFVFLGGCGRIEKSGEPVNTDFANRFGQPLDRSSESN